MEHKTTIGSRLRQLRADRQLNQVDVAVAVGISRSHLSKIENNQDTPSRTALSALATFYNVTMDYLETGAATRGAQGADQPLDDGDLAWARLGRALDLEQRTAVFDFIQKMAGRRPGARGTSADRHRNK